MYFPYLRGKQFELLALKDLVRDGKISSKVIPVIEPLKPSSTLITTLNTFISNDLDIVVISNPSVGNFLEECLSPDKEAFRRDYEIIRNNPRVLFGVDLDNHTNINREDLETFSSKIVAVCKNTDSIPLHVTLINNRAKFNLIKDNKEFSREITENKVMLEDKFNVQKRNADYLNTPDELFSSDHLFYKNEGYAGFSDYSIVGSDFSEGGFAPYAIAIHIVYFDENKKVRVKHFTSISNNDYSDPAGKFQEAIEELVNCKDLIDISTDGLNELRACHSEERYPGLGSVKKMSLKHHLELMNNFLISEED